MIYDGYNGYYQIPKNDLFSLAIAWFIFIISPFLILLVIYIYKSLTGDSLKWIVALGIIISIYIYFDSQSVDLSKDVTDIENTQKLMNILSSSALVLTLLSHLFFASISRLFRTVRLSARSPRMGPRSLVLQYSSYGRVPLCEFAQLSGKTFLQMMLRSMIFTSVIISIIISMEITTINLFKIEDAYIDQYLPPLIAMIICIFILFRDAIIIRGVAFLSLALALSAIANFSVIVFIGYSAEDVNDIEGWSFQALLTFCAIAFRGWLLAPVRSSVERIRRSVFGGAEEVLARSAKEPVLLLRSFADDSLSVSSTFKIFAFAFGGVPDLRRMEEVVVEALVARGPIIALSNPNENRMSSLGASRQLLDNETWQNQIKEYMIRSQLIVCILGKTDSFRWEMHCIIEMGLLDKVIIVLPPGYPKNRTIAQCSPQLAAALGDLTVEEELASGARSRVIAYDAFRASWTSIKTFRANQSSYANALRIAAELNPRVKRQSLFDRIKGLIRRLNGSWRVLWKGRSARIS